MGDLNNIQDEINAEMQGGDLADVTFTYTVEREARGVFDPENPEPSSTETYSWTGIFGLQFTKIDTETFNIEQQDQKGLVFMRNGELTIPYEPKIDEVITVMGGSFRIVDMLQIPAENGWVLQLRKYG